LNPSNEPSRKNPLGPLEIILLAGLGLLAVGFFYLIFGPDLRLLAADLFRPEATPAAPQLEVVEFSSYVETLEEEVIPVRNCGATSEQDVEFERIRPLMHQFVLPEDTPPGVAPVLLAALERHYGFSQGQEVERRYILRMNAGPNSGADYLVEWQGYWVEGQVVVRSAEGEEGSIPYQALADLEFFFKDSRTVRCP
jgi:hypothetical protein